MNIKRIAINILRKLHRTLIDIVLLLVACFALRYLQDYLRGTKILFLYIVIFAILCDFIFTWIPTRVLSKDYRDQIKKVYFYSNTTGEVCLSDKETEAFKLLCMKMSRYFEEKDFSTTDIVLKFPLDDKVFCLFQSKAVENYFFIGWENKDSKLREVISLDEYEMKKIEHVIEKYRDK